METQSELLAARYGRKTPNPTKTRSRLIATAIALVAIFVAWAIWVTVDSANQVKHQDQAFVIIDETQATITFEITRPKPAAVVCAIQVLNQSYAVVGYLEVTVPASEELVVATTTRVNTTEKGVTGLVDKCWFK